MELTSVGLLTLAPNIYPSQQQTLLDKNTVQTLAFYCVNKQVLGLFRFSDCCCTSKLLPG